MIQREREREKDREAARDDGGYGAAAGVPVPPDGRGAGDALPRPALHLAADRRPHHRRARPLQTRPLGPPRAGAVRGEGVVLLLAAGPEVPEWVEAEPGGGERVLEGDWGRQADREPEAGRDQEGARVLRREGPPWGQDQLDHARVPPRRRR